MSRRKKNNSIIYAMVAVVLVLSICNVESSGAIFGKIFSNCRMTKVVLCGKDEMHSKVDCKSDNILSQQDMDEDFQVIDSMNLSRHETGESIVLSIDLLLILLLMTCMRFTSKDLWQTKLSSLVWWQMKYVQMFDGKKKGICFTC